MRVGNMATKKTAKKARNTARPQQQGSEKQSYEQGSKSAATARLEVRGEVDASRFLALRTIAGGESGGIQMVVVPARRKQKRVGLRG
jgi:hypothetical protein